jgi:hypothetical protein
LVLVAVGGLVGIVGRSNSADESFSSESIEEISSENRIIATLRVAEGTVETKNQDSGWTKIVVNHELTQGDDIRTVGATAKASIEFENGSVLRIDANSEVLLETTDSDRIVIKQTSGYSYSRVTPSDATSYTVKSTDAQYEAAGTAFLVITSGDEQAVEVYESAVIETSTNREVMQGKKLIVRSRISPSSNGTIEPLDIEIVKQNSFMTWNRKLDSENDSFKSNLGFLSDIVSPPIVITSPADNTTILLEPNATKGAVEFTGTSEPNTALSIVSKSSSEAVAIVLTTDVSGSFMSPAIEAPLGSSVFEFTATDRVGNITVQNIRLNFQRKSAPITGGGIVLSVAKNQDTIKVTLSYTGSFKPTNGVRVVYGEAKLPEFEKNDSVYSEDGSNTTIDLSELTKDTTFYFRACSYDNEKKSCSDYSNEVTFKTPS